MTQETLATRSGKHPAYLSGLERGERNPTYATLAQVAGALDVPVSKLVLDAENGPSPQ